MNPVVNIAAQRISRFIRIILKWRNQITRLHDHLLSDFTEYNPVQELPGRRPLLIRYDAPIYHNLFRRRRLDLPIGKILRIVIQKVWKKAIRIRILRTGLRKIRPCPVAIKPESGLSIHQVDGHLVIIGPQRILSRHVILP